MATGTVTGTPATAGMVTITGSAAKSTTTTGVRL
jgi:hypothetical protein